MRPITPVICILAISAFLTNVDKNEAFAGYPVYYAPAPAVVGYTARRAGLFGRRVVMRPVVAPVAVPAAVIAPPPPVAVAPVVVARPVVQVGYRGVAPVGVYVPPPVPVAVPVSAYRIPYAAYYPGW